MGPYKLIALSASGLLLAASVGMVFLGMMVSAQPSVIWVAQRDLFVPGIIIAAGIWLHDMLRSDRVR